MRRKMYKVIVLMVGIMVLFNAQMVFAAEKEELIVIDDVEEDDTKYDEISDYLENRGKEILSSWRYRASTVMLVGVKRYQQSYESWSEDIMSGMEGQTIGRSGCTLTCFTMAKNFLLGTDDNPGIVNRVLGSYACDFSWSGAAETYGLNIAIGRRYFTPAEISNSRANLIIIGAIDEFSAPVIVGYKDETSENTHFVLAYGYTSEGDIIIMDPASDNRTLLSECVNEQSNNFIHRIYTYIR